MYKRELPERSQATLKHRTSANMQHGIAEGAYWIHGQQRVNNIMKNQTRYQNGGGTLDAPEKAPRTPNGINGVKLLRLKCGMPAQKTKTITARLRMVTPVLNVAPPRVPIASKIDRPKTTPKAGKSSKKFSEPMEMRSKLASPCTSAPVYEVNDRAMAAPLRVYSSNRLEAATLRTRCLS